MRKLIASVALVTAVALGGLAVAAVNPLQIVSAKSSSHSATAATPDTSTAAPAGRRGREAGKLLDKALAGLVQKGTITSSQAAAVKEAIKTEIQTFAKNHKGLRQDLRQGLRKGVVVVSAKAIGISPQDLVKALRSGSSIAQVAQSHHVDPSDVVKAIVTAGNHRVDTALNAHKIDAARAAKIKQRLPQLAEKIVNRVPGAHGGAGGN